MGVFLGIDIGTSGTKTLAIDPTGKILADAMETFTRRLDCACRELEQRGYTFSTFEEPDHEKAS